MFYTNLPTPAPAPTPGGQSEGSHPAVCAHTKQPGPTDSCFLRRMECAYQNLPGRVDMLDQPLEVWGHLGTQRIQAA